MIMAVVVFGMLTIAGQARPEAPATDAKLLVTVTDPSGAVIPTATVTVTPAEGSGAKSAATSDKGQVGFEGLVPGRYTIHAEFAGFDPATLTDVRLRAGENRHVVVLHLSKVEEAVTVSRDPQTIAADPHGMAFKSVLSLQEVEALSDDPTEMAQQLIEMAGGNAVIKIDSFVGGTLPPKAQIKSIHIVRDTFAAENHSAEADEIDIITQPGVGALHGGGGTRLRDDALNARNAFAATKGPEQTQAVDGNIGGTLVKNKSSFSLNVRVVNSFDTPILVAATPRGFQNDTLGQRPADNWSMSGLVDYALTHDQTFRFAFEHSSQDNRNQGVGQYDFQERAYSTTASDSELRFQVVGQIGRRMFANTRLQVQWADTAAHSAVEAETIRIADSATRGGAQRAGGRHPRDLEFGSDIDYVKGIHSVRGGVLMEGGHYRTDDSTNYLGTYFFTSNDAFVAGLPSTYTRRIGDPLIGYDNLQAAVYIQDDLRINKGLTLSPGLRYEAQTHVRDYNNVGPRFGFNWSPAKSGRTTLRGSAGIFYQWLNTGTYEQTLRVDGVHQLQLNIANPSFPDPGIGTGEIPPGDKYQMAGDLKLARSVRVSAGIDRTLSPKLRFNATYSHVRFGDVLRGENLNAPVGGLRPDARYANVIQVVSDAEQHSHQLATTLTVNLSAPGRATTAPTWNWRRSSVRLNYRIASASNNTDGAFNPPPSGTLATEWGPTAGDVRHRIQGSWNGTMLRNVATTVGIAATSGSPYTITTGFDENGDLIFNDRPTGIGRNSERTPWQVNWTANVSYSIDLGPSATVNRQEVRGSGGQAPAGRHRLVFTLSATNLANRTNFGGYSGVMTSPFFLQPTSAAAPRRLELGMSLRF